MSKNLAGIMAVLIFVCFDYFQPHPILPLGRDTYIHQQERTTTTAPRIDPKSKRDRLQLLFMPASLEE